MDRETFAGHIAARLDALKEDLTRQYQRSEPLIGYFVVDDLFPGDVALNLAKRFPSGGMTLNSSLRERKFVSAQMNRHDPAIEEALFAFHAPAVVELVAAICGARQVEPDEHLYAGGISAMTRSHFLNPHLDNSHDKDRERWRVFNLLYYVSPEAVTGGELELWPDGPGGRRIAIPPVFNRLVVMATHDSSWHSVSPVTAGTRRCISNYYFSPEPPRSPAFHVTSFRGRPEQPIRNVVLRLDAGARSLIRQIKPSGIGSRAHLYQH